MGRGIDFEFEMAKHQTQMHDKEEECETKTGTGRLIKFINQKCILSSKWMRGGEYAQAHSQIVKN